MNRTRIEWCDYTWNPITGCRHGCRYCYARRMTSRFAGDVRLNLMAKKDYSLIPSADSGQELYVLEAPMMNETGNPLIYPFGFAPTLHRYRLSIPEKLKTGTNIFVGSMADVFGEWVPDEWIEEVFEACRKYPTHNYLFLTKNPGRYQKLEEKGLLPKDKNMWYGFSCTNNQDHRWTGKGVNSFISVEPLLEDLDLFGGDTDAPAAGWVIIGAETGKSLGKVVPKMEWIGKILAHCDRFGIPVFMKDSLIPIVGAENMRREFPPGLLVKRLSPRMQEKMYDVCAGCGKYQRKGEMLTMMARSRRGEPAKQLGFLCRSCFAEFCGDYGFAIPKFAYMEDEESGEDAGK